MVELIVESFVVRLAVCTFPRAYRVSHLGGVSPFEWQSMATRVRLIAIPSADEALCDLGMFVFVALHVLSAGGRHLPAVVELLCLVERMEELHIEVQGMISCPHMAPTYMYDLSWWWSQCLNWCVAVSASEVLEEPGASVPFSLEPIMAELKCGGYVGPILSGPWRTSSQGDGRQAEKLSEVAAVVAAVAASAIKKSKVVATGGGQGARVWAQYNVHLPSLSLQGGENSRTLLSGTVLPTLHSHVL